MLEITEETLTAQVAACSVRWEPQLEDSIGVAIGGYRPHNEYCRACKPILWALAEIRRLRGEITERDGQVGALVDVVTRYHEALPSPESTTILANLSKAAAAYEKRLKAEGAAEAFDDIRAQAEEVAKQGTLSGRLLRHLTLECLEKAEAARLREEAGR